MKTRHLFVAAVLLFATSSAYAYELSTVDAANQYKAYPSDNIPQQTPAPAGYEPFHMEHYGRHGSRWLIDKANYQVPVTELEKAERNSVLTDEGKEVLALVRRVNSDSQHRLGELTDLGARQHRGIARRMTENYPTLFAPGTHVDAKSTVVIRCILSMLNEIEELARIEPKLTFKTDASFHDMYYMNFSDPERNAACDKAKSNMDDFKARRANKGEYLRRLVSDDKFIRDSIDNEALFNQLFEVALNMQSHDGEYPSMMGLFTQEEIKNKWEISNAIWMIDGAHSTLTDNKSPRVQRNLLANMILSADTAMVSPGKSVNLRFGHETMVLALSCLLELADYGREFNDLENLANEFRVYEIFPMACNVQMVFYRPAGSVKADDVLVKVLLNEREMPLSALKPVKEGSPYYRWSDVRPFLLKKAEIQ